MADFMTVLAASQKQAPTSAHGKTLAGLLPEGLFENVLSAQIGAATEVPASLLALPSALSEQFTLADKPAARKSPAADLVTDQAAAPVLAFTDAVVRDKPVARASEEDAEPVVAPTVARAMRSKMAPEAATPAAAGATQRQELPPSQQLLVAAAAQSTATTAAVVGLSPLLGAEAKPLEAAKLPDPAVVAATRQLGQFEHLTRTAETPVRATVETPLRGQGFAAEFSEKIVWLAGRQAQVADLSLNPPQLGSLEVRLSLSGNDAGAQFYSPNPQVRDAIEAALPKLRELMAQAGIALGDAQVRDEAFSRGEAGASARAGSGAASDQTAAALMPVSGGAIRAGLGLVDLYV